MRGKGRYHVLLELSKRELVKKVIGIEGVQKMHLGKIKKQRETIQILKEFLHDLGYKVEE